MRSWRSYHEVVNLVTLGKSVNEILLVLPHALHEVRGHAKVKSPIAAAAQEIDAGLFHLAHENGLDGLLHSGF
jgi:hypothetical protein